MTRSTSCSSLQNNSENEMKIHVTRDKRIIIFNPMYIGLYKGNYIADFAQIHLEVSLAEFRRLFPEPCGQDFAIYERGSVREN